LPADDQSTVVDGTFLKYFHRNRGRQGASVESVRWVGCENDQGEIDDGRDTLFAIPHKGRSETAACSVSARSDSEIKCKWSVVAYLMQHVAKVMDDRFGPKTVLDLSIVQPYGHSRAGLKVKLWQAVESHSGGTHEYHMGSTSSCQP